MPVDFYIGGSEHTTLHLLYSRFWHKFLYDIGKVSTPEPYQKRIDHGILLGADGRKMSKSFGNVINPDKVCKEYGVDTIRTYLMFMGPFSNTMSWNVDTVAGVRRFLEKLYRYVNMAIERGSKDSSEKVEFVINKTIKKVTESLDRLSFNTAVASMMEMMNEISKDVNISKGSLEKILKLLSPFAPYVTEELWEKLGNTFSIHVTDWPDVDEKVLVEDVVVLPVQVNGKLRGEIEVKKDMSEEDIKKSATSQENVKKYLEGKTIKKFVYVPGRIANIVV
jgi:leucyl-tRNA synthetase